jgi:hypothetical protein
MLGMVLSCLSLIVVFAGRNERATCFLAPRMNVCPCLVCSSIPSHMISYAYAYERTCDEEEAAVQCHAYRAHGHVLVGSSVPQAPVCIRLRPPINPAAPSPAFPPIVWPAVPRTTAARAPSSGSAGPCHGACSCGWPAGPPYLPAQAQLLPSATAAEILRLWLLGRSRMPMHRAHKHAP